ncbi:MAG: hypothetical protein GY801_37840 [bacterium]|nr:hypothetical protein [bacterium]
MTRFEARSQEIDTVLEVIREITDQTSLLALNALIISAQAGVHGRGFAVVAEEIRNLAQGVGASTKSIASIVTTLQQETAEVAHTKCNNSAVQQSFKLFLHAYIHSSIHIGFPERLKFITEKRPIVE